MKRALLWLSFTLAATGVLLLYPESTHALNPNHQCSFCHGLHSAPGTQLKKDADVEVLCLTCHGPAGISIFKADVHTNDTPTSYAAFSITCMRCHNPHSDRVNWLGSHNHPDGSTWSGINIKLVGRKDPSGAIYDTLEWDAVGGSYADGVRNVVFEQRGHKNDPDLQIHSFSDEDQDGNGVKDGACETCHTQTKHHCNGDATNTGQCGVTHNTGKTCTDCHAHVDNFIP